MVQNQKYQYSIAQVLVFEFSLLDLTWLWTSWLSPQLTLIWLVPELRYWVYFKVANISLRLLSALSLAWFYFRDIKYPHVVLSTKIVISRQHQNVRGGVLRNNWPLSTRHKINCDTSVTRDITLSVRAKWCKGLIPQEICWGFAIFSFKIKKISCVLSSETFWT